MMLFIGESSESSGIETYSSEKSNSSIEVLLQTPKWASDYGIFLSKSIAYDVVIGDLIISSEIEMYILGKSND